MKPPWTHLTLADFLTDDEIDRAWHLYQTVPENIFAEAVDNQVIKPNMERINKALGQENDSRYLAYAVLYVFSTAQHRQKGHNGQ